MRIIEGIKKIYEGPNVVPVHVLFLVYSLLCACIDPKNAGWHTAALGIVVGAFVVYLGGWGLQFLHNCFDEQFELPVLNSSPLGVFLKAFPLLFVWGIYLLVILGIFGGVTVAFAVSGIVPKLIVVLVALISVIAIILFSVFAQFVYVVYSKDYSPKGLWNILIPFTFIEKYFAKMLSLIGQMALIFIGLFGLVIIAGFLFAMFKVEGPVPEILVSGLADYVTMVVGYACGYCLVKIYKEEPLT